VMNIGLPNQITSANAGERLGFAVKSRVGLSPEPGVAISIVRQHESIHPKGSSRSASGSCHGVYASEPVRRVYRTGFVT
jgi:hypothetical protein